MPNYFSLDKNISVPPVFQQKYIPSLNGLRALAVILVIFGHIKYGAGAPGFFTSATRYIEPGSFGVQVFFVISGFLITGLLLKEKVETGSISLKRFYLRRAIRILPVFYTYIAVIIILKLLHIVAVDGKAILAASLFVSNFGNFHSQWIVAHLWTLSVEQQFYLLCPVIAVFLPRKYIFLFTGIIIYYVLYYYLRQYSLMFLFRGFLMMAPALISGAFLSIALFKNWLSKYHSILMHPICAFSLVYAIIIYVPRISNFLPFVYIPFDYLSSSFFIAVFIYYAIHCNIRNPVYLVLNFPVVAYIGVLSYSIYIWQQPFFAGASNYYVYAVWAHYPLNIALALIMAYISYNVIEKPFLKLKKHIKYPGNANSN